MTKKLFILLFLLLPSFSYADTILGQSATSSTQGLQGGQSITTSIDYAFQFRPSFDAVQMDRVDIKMCRSGQTQGAYVLNVYEGTVLDGYFEYNLLANSPEVSYSNLYNGCGSGQVENATNTTFVLTPKLDIRSDTDYVFVLTATSTNGTGSLFEGSYTPDNNWELFQKSTSTWYRVDSQSLTGDFIYGVTIRNFSYSPPTWNDSLQVWDYDLSDYFGGYSSTTLFGTSTLADFSRESFQADMASTYGCGSPSLSLSASILCALTDAFAVTVMPSDALLDELWTTLTVTSKDAFPFSAFWIWRDTMQQVASYATTTPTFSELVPDALLVDESNFNATTSVLASLGNDSVEDMFSSVASINTFFRDSNFWQVNVRWLFSLLAWTFFGFWLLRRCMSLIGFEIGGDWFSEDSDTVTDTEAYNEEGTRLGFRRVRTRRYSRGLL